MLIGYARVSRAEQRLDLQLDALERVGCDKIFQDVISGVKSKKNLETALECLRAGDTLIVWRFDRLGRSLKRLIELVNELQDREITFKSLIETIDTSTAAGKFFFHITGAFAELERNLIRDRTLAGLASARARGRVGGRPKALDEKTFAMAFALYDSKTHTVREICARFEISERTFYRRRRQHLLNATSAV